MSEIKKMQRYIDRTKTKHGDNYSMVFGEASALANMTVEKPLDAILLAFKYSKAKGYRAAKAEVRV